MLLVNGMVPAKTRRENVARFQDDASGPQLILVQSQAGKGASACTTPPASISACCSIWGSQRSRRWPCSKKAASTEWVRSQTRSFVT